MTMKKRKKLISLMALLAISTTSSAYLWETSAPNDESFGSRAWMDKEISILHSRASNIDDKVLRLSLQAYVKAKKRGLDEKSLLTVIDYSKPSTEKRLWVFDLKTNKTLFNTWVSHGKNSGGNKPDSFSNTPGSLKSSLGVFLTSETYIGSKGYSLRLRGLENGINDQAYNRDIVIHGAWYVSADTIRRYGQIGRSWGCPAVSPDTVKPLINTIKDSTLVFAYYPDRKWLNNSSFLSA